MDATYHTIMQLCYYFSSCLIIDIFAGKVNFSTCLHQLLFCYDGVPTASVEYIFASILNNFRARPDEEEKKRRDE